MDIKKIEKLDAEVVRASGKIRVLKALEWPADSESAFLQQWKAGAPQLPKIKFNPVDCSESVASLEKVVSQCDQNDPAEKFLANTAQSYADAGKMLGHMGTPDFTRYSAKIYGRPDSVYKLQGMTAVDGAVFFLKVTDDLLGNASFPPTVADISAKRFCWMAQSGSG